jgi:hypothetical protein
MSANVRHSAASVEHYTPAPIVEAARRVMGGIDLDPFSCRLANETVKAARFYSGEVRVGPYDPAPSDMERRVCGFSVTWDQLADAGKPGATKRIPSRVFVNPPGGKYEGQSCQKRAWFQAASEHAAGRASHVFVVCFSLELLQTTQVKASGKIPLDFPICYPSRRIAYMREPTLLENARRAFKAENGKRWRAHWKALKLTDDDVSVWADKYDGPALIKGKSPPHSSCFIYLPPPSAEPMWNRDGVQRFVREFSLFGRVVIPATVGA